MISINTSTLAENRAGFLAWFDRQCAQVLRPHRLPIPAAECRRIAAAALSSGALVAPPPSPPQPVLGRPPGRTRHAGVKAALEEFIALHGYQPDPKSHRGEAKRLALKHGCAMSALNSALYFVRHRKTAAA